MPFSCGKLDESSQMTSLEFLHFKQWLKAWVFMRYCMLLFTGRLNCFFPFFSKAFNPSHKENGH